MGGRLAIGFNPLTRQLPFNLAVAITVLLFVIAAIIGNCKCLTAEIQSYP